MEARTLWHAEGLRWIGSLFNAAAERLERNVDAPLDPHAYREIEEYVSDVRTRAHLNS